MTTLPRLFVLTDRTRTSRPLVEVVGAAVDAGARAVLLREKDLSPAQRSALAAELRPLVAAVGGLLVHASRPAGAADGLHLAAHDPFPDARPALLGRSCHGPEELAAAAAAGCDWATLSPIHATASKPGHGPALGPDALAAPPLPTYALGGVTPATAAACVAAGAHGVAVMGAVMRADDPAAVTAALLAAVEPGGAA